MSYLLDANVFIAAKNLHYGLDFCVTHEAPSDSRAHIKIPNACIGLGVRFMTPYQMLRIEQARFVLGAPA
jgi:hypothetical protein